MEILRPMENRGYPADYLLARYIVGLGLVVVNGANLGEQIRRFAASDRQTRLELLLDFSQKLPALPERLLSGWHRDSRRLPARAV